MTQNISTYVVSEINETYPRRIMFQEDFKMFQRPEGSDYRERLAKFQTD